MIFGVSLFTSAIMVHPESNGVPKQECKYLLLKTFHQKSNISTLPSAVQKSITELREITRGKGQTKENE